MSLDHHFLFLPLILISHFDPFTLDGTRQFMELGGVAWLIHEPLRRSPTRNTGHGQNKSSSCEGQGHYLRLLNPFLALIQSHLFSIHWSSMDPI